MSAPDDKCNEPSLYKEKSRIQNGIYEKIRPMFLDLRDENLFSKCLHGEIQSNNESINNVTLNWCSKDVNIGFKTLEFGVGISGDLSV